MLLSTLENPLDTGLFVPFQVRCTGLSRRTVNDNVTLRKEVTDASAARVSCIGKGLDFRRFVKGAKQRISLANSQIAPKGGARLRDANDGHVVLCGHCIRNSLADGSVPVDGHLDGHALRCQDGAYELHDGCLEHGDEAMWRSPNERAWPAR